MSFKENVSGLDAYFYVKYITLILYLKITFQDHVLMWFWNGNKTSSTCILKKNKRIPSVHFNQLKFTSDLISLFKNRCKVIQRR